MNYIALCSLINALPSNQNVFMESIFIEEPMLQDTMMRAGKSRVSKTDTVPCIPKAYCLVEIRTAD